MDKQTIVSMKYQAKNRMSKRSRSARKSKGKSTRKGRMSTSDRLIVLRLARKAARRALWKSRKLRQSKALLRAKVRVHLAFEGNNNVTGVATWDGGQSEGNEGVSGEPVMSISAYSGMLPALDYLPEPGYRFESAALREARTVKDLHFVPFDQVDGLTDGIEIQEDRSAIIVSEPGDYRIGHTVMTDQISYFVVNVNGSVRAASQYDRASEGSVHRDSGETVVTISEVPAMIKLQNVTGETVTVSDGKAVTARIQRLSI